MDAPVGDDQDPKGLQPVAAPKTRQDFLIGKRWVQDRLRHGHDTIWRAEGRRQCRRTKACGKRTHRIVLVKYILRRGADSAPREL